MKNLLQLQYKAKIGLWLFVLISVILINNIASRKNVSHLNDSVSSIYKDRLLVATYIFELTNHLYEKKLLFHTDQKVTLAATEHDAQIIKLMKLYEQTLLTKEEVRYWSAFKSSLHQYNTLTRQGYPAPDHFESTLQNLKYLSALQANEGKSLFKTTRSDMSALTLGSYLEISFTVFIGLFTLMLIGLSKIKLSSFNHNPSLN